jgi:hypothetical protein
MKAHSISSSKCEKSKAKEEREEEYYGAVRGVTGHGQVE